MNVQGGLLALGIGLAVIGWTGTLFTASWGYVDGRVPLAPVITLLVIALSGTVLIGLMTSTHS